MDYVLAQYIADYLNEELEEHGQQPTAELVLSAIEAYEGGAR